jgi:hypothetical protein
VSFFRYDGNRDNKGLFRTLSAKESLKSEFFPCFAGDCWRGQEAATGHPRAASMAAEDLSLLMEDRFGALLVAGSKGGINSSRHQNPSKVFGQSIASGVSQCARAQSPRISLN